VKMGLLKNIKGIWTSWTVVLSRTCSYGSWLQWRRFLPISSKFTFLNITVYHSIVKE